jgi:hypothetical protein
MPQVKRAAKGKRPNKAVSVLGIAGVSLAASTGGSPADMPPPSLASSPAGSVADLLWQDAAPPHARRGGNLRRQPGDVSSL